MKLTTRLIFKLAEIKDSIAQLQSNEKILVERIKKVMKRKNLESFGPSDSPQKFVFSEFEKTQVPWKEEWQLIARKHYGKKWKKVQKALTKRNKKWESRLCLEKNERFKPKRKAHNLRKAKRGKR